MKNNNEFRILSAKEESLLSTEELREYYIQLRKYVLNRKLTNTTPGATTIAPKLKGITNKIATILTDILAGGNVEKIYDGIENIPEGPVIFAHTHQGLLDNFAWIPATPKHSIPLHSNVVKKALILAQLNTGLVLVSKNKEDIENRINAKLDMMSLLSRGHSISYFPESAWNLSPNKLHLPMSYGFLDIAKKMGVPVVPVVDEFTYDSSSEKERITKIHIRFGKPMYIYENDNLLKKLDDYLEQISTIRWELIEEKGMFKRKNISKKEYSNYLQGNLNNLKIGGIDINVERQNLWNADDYFYKLHHINDVAVDENGILLETTEQIKIKKLINNNKFLQRK